MSAISSVYMLIFRIVHIASAVAWAGSVFMFVTFVLPASATTGAAGAPLMGELLGRRRLVDRLIGLGVLTVAGGIFLYWHDSQVYGGIGSFARTTFGTWLTIGALSAISALAIGAAATRPRVQRLLAIGRQATEAGGPTPEQAAEMGALQGQLQTLARASLALIGVAVFCMATARYW
jgi:uncharacterized membrane protein